MKNIIVGVITLVIFGAMGYTISQGTAFQGGQAAKIIENVSKTQNTVSQQKTQAISEKSDRDIEAEKIKALKDKAGNAVSFKVSDNYKKKCASCHGAGGEGIVGLPLFGQSAEQLYTKLLEFKSGKRNNPIMMSAIMNLNEEDFKELSQEIGDFKNRAEALK
ncbi:c-type cytochrome [Sulfurospirillum diekertiae]|uniref:Nitrous oxide reductase heme protein NosC2 n=1 Tax=Sulfurospirillum diekertiae TaxID=1854492 RepID=A0A1Y0HJB7_9BACT|nr:c-type cytochrome [Sulfurospirillum diekertiae]ARU48142.1 nitrous oxide reductase heme protein NosC2 [Sulfurospirillum diekertiae]ASC92985.1 nitrous oxide reductase heme protein NosC2 [Sulfurospirillum diekertiae]